MTIEDIIKQITEKLITLPDQTGLAKCAGFYMLYQGIKTLEEALKEEREKNETEKNALRERIKELESKVKE